MKILIADDEEIIRNSLEGILKKGGDFETDFAFDGEEALEKIKANLYDLLLLDLDMPKISGYAVLKGVRAIFPEMPVVFVTGKGDPRKVVKSITEEKLSAFLEKPFTPEGVLQIVKKLLTAKKISS